MTHQLVAALPFADSREQLCAELKRVSLLLLARSLQLRARDGGRDPWELRGLYIDDDEVDRLFAGLTEEEAAISGAGSPPERLQLVDRARMLEEEIERRRQAGQDAGVTLPIDRLQTHFGLTRFDIEAILVCLAPELDRRYERLYGYLQDDVTKRSPSVGLVLDILAPLGYEPLANRGRFLPDEPLLKHDLLRVPAGADVPLLSQPLKLDERIVSYLLGFDQIDARLLGSVRWAGGAPKIEELVLAPALREALSNLVPAYQDQHGHGLWPVLVFQGQEGAGQSMAAGAFAQTLGLRLLRVDAARLADHTLAPPQLIRLILREARLQNAALYWSDVDSLLACPAGGAWHAALSDALRESGVICILAGEAAWEAGGRIPGITPVLLQFPPPSFEERMELWRRHLDAQEANVPEEALPLLADKFRLSGAQISASVATARGLALGRDPGDHSVTVDDLHAACRLQSNQRLAALSQKVQPRYRWDDIILPKDQLAQLQELCNHLKHRHVVYGDWGFDRKLSLGKGLNVLFSGPSGTGKTMAAEIIADELGLDLYKIDLSLVVSKYIGETEKNLNGIFREAATSNAILFFDEADALFGKRSEVRDSHDRYANIEIAYLLQKMEEYEGVVILATNLRKNLDEAFQRRMHFSVDFPFPEEEYRHRIWGKVFPPAAPVAEEAALDFMARSFKMTGGNIKNIALAAAFLAASDGRVIGMEHLIRATKREYQKMGKLMVEADFGPYAELVKAE